jgi:hypothetical protein
MTAEPPVEPHATVPDDERRRHDLRTRLTVLRLRTQLLHRFATEQEGIAWPRMAAGLEALDADLATLFAQLDHHDEG